MSHNISVNDNGSDDKSSFLTDNQELKTTPYRWLMLFSFTICSVSSSHMMMSFAPIALEVSKLYKVDDFWVTQCVVVFLYSFILFNFSSVSALEKSMNATLKLSALLTVVGCWLRFVTLTWTGDFRYLLVAQSLIAAAQPFIYNAVSKLSTIWFADDERALATTIGSLSNPVGCIVGLACGPMFVGANYEKDMYHQGKQDVEFYLFITCIMCTVMCLPLIVLFKEKPEYFPSKAAMSKQKQEFDFKQDVKDLLSNGNYMLMSLCFVLLYGLYTCLGSIINQLMQPYGIEPMQSSIIGVLGIISGIVGSFTLSVILDKYQKFLLCLRATCFGSFFFICFIPFTLPSGNFYLLCGNVMAVLFFTIAMIPVGFSFAIELTYPVSEALSNGFMMLLAQLAGSGITQYATWMMKKNKDVCIWGFVIQMFCAFLCTLCIKEDLRRVNLQKEGNKQSQISDGLLEGTPQTTTVE